MNLPLLLLHLAGGIVAGTLYFASLWWNAGLFGQGGRVRVLIAAVAVRFLLLGLVLTAASFEGAMPLLVTAAGVLVARAVVIRRARIATP